MNRNPYDILAYYYFTPIADPHQEIAAHQAFFKGRDLTSRIYLSENGINGQMSGIRADIEAYMEWMHANPLFENMPFKIHPYHENVFPRQTIKYRKQLVALDEEVDLSRIGEHVSPAQWKELLQREEKPVLLDVRNDYEWEVGRFDGAVCPPCETFREFRAYAEELNAGRSKDNPSHDVLHRRHSVRTLFFPTDERRLRKGLSVRRGSDQLRPSRGQ